MIAESTSRTIRRAEQVLAILEEGTFTATYKYAVLLALLDLCMEGTATNGMPVTSITTRQLAEKVVELYWPHTAPFGDRRPSRVLKQNASHAGSQAEIVRRIQQFRGRHAPDPSAPLVRARNAARGPFEGMVKAIEWKLIEMPLARLQFYAGRDHDFLYRIGWQRADTEGGQGRGFRREVRDYQAGLASNFDNRLLLHAGASEDLVLLNGLLRPLIHRRWAAMVARLNRLEDSRLEDFLFGADRISLAPVREPLRGLQRGQCFYCKRRIRGEDSAEVDHFIPWARYPDNGLSNLVLAHRKCNAAKRDHLATERHLENWLERLGAAGALVEIAADRSWDYRPDRSLGVASALYLGLPAGAPLWLESQSFEGASPPSLARVLRSRAGPLTGEA